jgi:hypothetical protein
VSIWTRIFVVLGTIDCVEVYSCHSKQCSLTTMWISIIALQVRDFHQKDTKKQSPKTNNSGYYSLVVTHLTTIPPVCCVVVMY